jgi:uncharacterized protein (DUF2147 family)
MRIYGLALQAAALAGALLSTGAARADTSPLGLWIDHTGRGAVEITECGGRLCGYVAWVKDPKDAEGCGEQIIGDVKPIGGGKWDNGWIWDPDSATKYDVELTPVGADKLRVMGYAGTKWLSESMTWKRAPASLQKCTKPGAGAAAPAAVTPVAAAAAAAAPAAAAAEEKPAVGAAEKSEPALATAAASPQKTDKKTDDKKSEPDATKIVSQIVQALADDTEVVGKGSSRSKSKRTCRVQVPYLGLVSFPCED